MYGEDMEFCWRASKHGVRSVYLPDVSITHLGGGGINHGSLRSLIVSDAGRLQAMRLMRGLYVTQAFKVILMVRSLVRATTWCATGLLTNDKIKLRQAGNHGIQFLQLAGVYRKAV
jgi:GT2 family glycosyltransferase